MANGIKTGGRKKGTPNKLTKELRFTLKNILYNELERLEDNLEGMEPKERIELLIKMMPYAFPKLESVCHTTNEPLDFGFD